MKKGDAETSGRARRGSAWSAPVKDNAMLPRTLSLTGALHAEPRREYLALWCAERFLSAPASSLSILSVSIFEDNNNTNPRS